MFAGGFAEVQESFLREGTAAVAEEGEDGGFGTAVGTRLEGEFRDRGGFVADLGDGGDVIFVFFVLVVVFFDGWWFGGEPGGEFLLEAHVWGLDLQVRLIWWKRSRPWVALFFFL